MMDRNEFLKLVGITSVAGSFIPFVKQASNKLIKPSRLQMGGTIGLVSPGFILPEEEKYDEIEEIIQELGFKVKVGTHARDKYGYLAGEDEARAADLNAMFANTEIDAIIPFRGGWGSNRILNLLDYKTIQQNPKPLIGFSDITSLLLAIYAKTDLVTFHGPVGKSEWTDFTISQFKLAVMDAVPLTLRNPEQDEITTISPGKARGPLLGGNLTVLTSMIGSGFLPDFSGAILFLEDVGEDVYRIDRMLTQLKLNGILDRINGIILGKFVDCEPGNDFSLTLEQVFADHIGSLGIPACRGSMIGHIDDMFTLPIGLPAELDAGSGAISFLESAVI